MKKFYALTVNFGLRIFVVLFFLQLYFNVTASIANSQTIPAGTWSNVVYSSSGITPTARHENGFVEVNGKFYLIGGRVVKNVNIFDPATNIWTLGAVSPIELNHFQAVVFNNEIYAICAFKGSYPNEVPVDNVYKYNTQTNTWTTGILIPPARRRGSAGVVLFQNKFYIVGGIKNGHIDGWVPWVDVYDPVTGAWQTLPDAPVARDHFMATLINGKIYAAGGRQTHFPDYAANTIGNVDVFDIVANSWSSPTQIPTQRGAPGVAIVNGELVIAGGEVLSSGSALKVVEAYNPITNTWKTKPDLNVGRHATQMISYQGKLFLCAGSTTRGGSGQNNTMATADYTSTGAVQQVLSFTMINANTEQDIQTINANSTLNLATLPAQNLNIRANTSPATVGSVVFALTGTQTRNQTETGLPYALFGDVSGNYNSWIPAVGSYILKATPFSASGGGGTAGTPLIINFNVINQPNQGNRPPVITKPANVTLSIGQSWSFQVIASDPDAGDVLTYSATNLPASLTINANSGLISGNFTSTGGPYTVNLTVRDQDGLTASTSFVITVAGTNAITSFTLVNANNEQDIQALTSTSVLNLATLPSQNLNVRANTNPATIGSVVFALSGSQIQNRTESGAPYALFGDVNGNYNSWTPAVGSYILKATPFSGSSGGGTVGTPLTINFDIVNQPVLISSPNNTFSPLIESSEKLIPNSNSSLVSVYPNPVRESFFVKLSVKEKSEWQFVLYNTLGHSIQLPKANLEKGMEMISFDLGKYELLPGLYYLRMVSNLNDKKIARIIID
jgi:hypothetical protein